MKLYGFPPSPRTLKPILVARHLGLSLEVELVDLMQGQQKAQDMLKLNPNGRLPILEDNDFVLWESDAIVQYLADKVPGRLMPTDVRGRALVQQWLSWDLAHWDAACASLLYERVIKQVVGAGAPDATRIAEGEDKFRQAASVLNEHLAGQDYVVRNALSVVEFVLAAPLHYAVEARFPISEYPHIMRWFGHIARLDTWQQSTPQKLT